MSNRQNHTLTHLNDSSLIDSKIPREMLTRLESVNTLTPNKAPIVHPNRVYMTEEKKEKNVHGDSLTTKSPIATLFASINWIRSVSEVHCHAIHLLRLN